MGIIAGVLVMGVAAGVVAYRVRKARMEHDEDGFDSEKPGMDTVASTKVESQAGDGYINRKSSIEF